MSDSTQEPDFVLDTKENPEDLQINSTVQYGGLDDLLALRPTLSELYIPEVQKTFYIRTLNGHEVDVYRTSITVGKGQNQTVNQRGMRAKLVVMALGNADGTRMLTDKDTMVVQQWPSKVLERIFDRARKFNGLTDEDTDDEKGNS